MAGNYTDVPGHRFAIDKDGSIGAFYRTSTGLVTQFTPTQMQAVNDENPATLYALTNYGPGWIGIFFPEKRNIAGIYVKWTGVGGAIETSVDSTNGQDGTWVATGTTITPSSGPADVPGYRTAITTLAAVGVKAIRMNITNATSQDLFLTSFHLYGSISATENPNRLRIWHPTLDEEVGGAYLDWGDAPRSSSADRTFRVKNNSSSQTANSIVLGFDALTDTTPSVPGQYLLSTDGTTFAATRTIASLAPGAISSVLTMRRVTPSNATLSLWAARLNAEATTWS